MEIGSGRLTDAELPSDPPRPEELSNAIAANAQSFQNKLEQLEQARAQGQSAAEVRLTAQEVAAALVQALTVCAILMTAGAWVWRRTRRH